MAGSKGWNFEPKGKISANPTPKKVTPSSLGSGNNIPKMNSQLASAAGFNGKTNMKVSGIQLGTHKHSPTSDGFQQHSL